MIAFEVETRCLMIYCVSTTSCSDN